MSRRRPGLRVVWSWKTGRRCAQSLDGIVLFLAWSHSAWVPKSWSVLIGRAHNDILNAQVFVYTKRQAKKSLPLLLVH